MSSWQPIETAPKGEVLLYFPPITGRNTQAAMMCVDRANGYPFRRPTHWQSLPPPPEAKT